MTELVIKLDDETYKEVMERTEFDTLSLGIKLIEAVQNGTALPKGHGDLIDADVLCDYFWDNRSKLYTHKDLRIVIHRQLTIIEADKENKE